MYAYVTFFEASSRDVAAGMNEMPSGAECAGISMKLGVGSLGKVGEVVRVNLVRY